MTEEQEIAQAMAAIARAAVGPLLIDIKALQASLGSWELRWNDLGAMRERIAVLETRAPIPGPIGPQGPVGEKGDRGEKGDTGLAIKGDRGERGDKGDPGESIVGPVGPRGEKGEPGLNVKGDPGERGERGESVVGPIGPRGEKGEPGLSVKGETGERGAPGKDADEASLQRLVGELVTKAVAEIPRPKDGRDGADGIGLKGDRGEIGPQGAGLTDLLINREGHLVVTFSDGRTKDVGHVVGKDGAVGINGKDVDLLTIQHQIAQEVGKIPIPKDGKDGTPGRDGFAPEDFDWDFDPDTRAFTIKFMRGGIVIAERTKTLIGMRIYRGVYEQGKTYEHGDVTTWGGSEWTAMAQTKDRPGNGATAWKLTVKHGDQGKIGPEGKPGRDGKDLTQMDGKGRKW